MSKVLQEYGNATRVQVSGAVTIGRGLPVAMIGFFVPSFITAQLIQFYTQTGAAVLTGQPVVGLITATAANSYFQFPAYFPTGLTVCVDNGVVGLTIFWQPAD